MSKITSWIQVLAKCPQCLVVNQMVEEYDNLRPYHKCQGCNQVFPIDLYRVFAFTNDVDHPLW